jgi:NADPH:quinone reductase-like Zn-dependent oxidoreductase
LNNTRAYSSNRSKGTGGVSLFALFICLAAGIKAIVTSSSDEKLEKLKKLGDVQGVNYRTHPDITGEVLRLTQDKGIDYVINNVGLKSVPEDLKMLRRSGTISVIGFLGGFGCDYSGTELWPILMKTAKIQCVCPHPCTLLRLGLF